MSNQRSRKRRRRLACFCAAALVLASGPAHALIARVFVKSTGVDGAACGLQTSPCRSLQTAHNNATAGGEIVVLDSGVYAGVIVTKSISIVNDGVGTAVVAKAVQNANAITIDAATTDRIHLRGLSVDGIGEAQNGIEINSAGAVEIVRCSVRRTTNNGLVTRPISVAAAKLEVFVSDFLASDNQIGMFISPGQSPTLGSPNRVQVAAFVKGATLENNSLHGMNVDGFLTTGSVKVVVEDSAATGNGDKGFLVRSKTDARNTFVVLDHVTASHNVKGLSVLNRTLARISRSTFSENIINVEFASSNAVVESFNNNVIRNDISSGVTGGALTPINPM